MAFTHPTRMVNPLLGTYFGIFMSGFVGLALLALIFEGLGAPGAALGAAMLSGPLVLYLAIGAASLTSEPLDYFATGRRVPAFYTGLGLAMTAMGGTGILALAGALFVIGFDALCLVIGGLAGFVFMAVLLAPFFRKFGAFTVPSYIGRRFDSRPLRMAAALVLAVPLVLVLAAELQIGAYVASHMVDLSRPVLVVAMAVVVVLTAIAGGMRSVTWTSAAQGIACLIALAVVVGIVGVLLTNLPLGQLSHGPVLRALGRGEAAHGLPIILPPALAFDMPGPGLQPIAKRFADAMSSVGPLAFVITMLTTLAGIASAPWLLPRVAATPGVYEARKSLGWATVLFGVIMLTLATVAVFLRAYLVDIFVAPGPPRVPDWLRELALAGLAGTVDETVRLQLTAVTFDRDGVLLALPIAARMPSVVGLLAAAGGLAASLAAAGAAMAALGNILAEDLVSGLSWEPAADRPRLVLARSGLVAAGSLGALMAISTAPDPLALLQWALAITGSAAFPVLVLSVWWKRFNAFGALAGLMTGFAVALLGILGAQADLTNLSGALSGAFGIPAAFVAAIAVTLVTPVPSKQVAEFVRDIRVPGGEILYDRETRLLRRKKGTRS